jgi:VanZ family protein
MTSRSPGWLLFGYFLGITVVITLAPFRFAWAPAVHLSYLLDPRDIAANVLLFVPLGFLFRASARTAAGRRPSTALVAGLCASAVLESVQIFLPGRFASPVDVATNAAGAWLGAALHERVQSRLDRDLVRGLALELPLMNLMYLLVPLLWLDGLAAGRETGRLVLGPVLGLAGGVVITAIWRHHLRQVAVRTPAGLAVLTGVWYAVGALPGLAQQPGQLMGGAGVIALLVWLQARRPLPATSERRYELPTLLRLWPLLGGYLLLSALWPVPWTAAPWHGGWELADLRDIPGLVPLLRRLEYLAAFTLLGYSIAEARGRRADRSVALALRVAVPCLAAAVLLEGLRGFHPAHRASGLALLLAGAAGLYGGLIYRRQLAVVRALLAPRTA